MSFQTVWQGDILKNVLLANFQTIAMNEDKSFQALKRKQKHH